MTIDGVAREVDGRAIRPGTWSIVVGGRSFLVYPNYETILDYNCAHLYALSVGMLADRLQ